jgi:hypothetical protein
MCKEVLLMVNPIIGRLLHIMHLAGEVMGKRERLQYYNQRLFCPKRLQSHSHCVKRRNLLANSMRLELRSGQKKRKYLKGSKRPVCEYYRYLMTNATHTNSASDAICKARRRLLRGPFCETCLPVRRRKRVPGAKRKEEY